MLNSGTNFPKICSHRALCPRAFPRRSKLLRIRAVMRIDLKKHSKQGTTSGKKKLFSGEGAGGNIFKTKYTPLKITSDRDEINTIGTLPRRDRYRWNSTEI